MAGPGGSRLREGAVRIGKAVRAVLATCAVAAASMARAADPPTAAPAGGDALRGRLVYQACQACHATDANDLGPRHRGVVGRLAGSVADYSYSPALRSSGLTWDAATLDRWLSNPSALVPGTKMYFRIDDAQRRADVIAYLEQLK